MIGRFERSFDLLRESWAILRQDKELLVFPLCSGICSILASALFIVPWFFFSDLPEELGRTGQNGSHFALSAVHYGVLFLLYLVNYFIVIFFNTGLIACAGSHLRGEPITAADGFRFATNNLGRIAAWAAIAATVGTILRAVEERVGLLGRIVAGLIGLAWTLATAFVVPVLVFEQISPLGAVRRSSEIFRKTWGESVIGNVGLGAAFSLFFLLGIVPIVLGCFALPWGLVAGIAIAVVYWIGLMVIQGALQGIYQTAVYEYAASGTLSPAFSEDLITQAYLPKKKKNR